MNDLHFEVYNPPFEVLTVIIQFAVYNPHFTVYNLHFKLYN